jgi:hypothetical protein
VPEIGCADDRLIKTCSGLFISKKVECIENAVWNKVNRKCFCKGSYFLDIDTRTCQKCAFLGKGQYCRNSSTDCYDTSYFELNLYNYYDVAGRGCSIDESRDIYEFDSSMHIIDGNT